VSDSTFTETSTAFSITKCRADLIEACHVLVAKADALFAAGGSNPSTRLHAARGLLSGVYSGEPLRTGQLQGMEAPAPSLTLREASSVAFAMAPGFQSTQDEIDVHRLAWHFETEVGRTVVALLLNSNLVGDWDDLATRFADATSHLVREAS
jgi:hypothetical protein